MTEEVRAFMAAGGVTGILGIATILVTKWTNRGRERFDDAAFLRGETMALLKQYKVEREEYKKEYDEIQAKNELLLDKNFKLMAANQVLQEKVEELTKLLKEKELKVFNMKPL